MKALTTGEDIENYQKSPAIKKIHDHDAINKDEEIPGSEAIAMGIFAECQVTWKTTGSPIPAIHKVINVSSTILRSTKQTKVLRRPIPF